MKKINKKLILYTLLASLILVLGACANPDDEAQPADEETGNQETTTNENENTEKDTDEEMEEMDHSNMDHSGSGEVPKGLKEAKNPIYPVGSKAIIQSDHMKGMKGAEATIVGAYDTTVYTVSYTPTTGGERVEDHKWVIQRRISGSR